MLCTTVHRHKDKANLETIESTAQSITQFSVHQIQRAQRGFEGLYIVMFVYECMQSSKRI